MDKNDLNIKDLCCIAQDAAKVILSFYQKDIAVERKDDNSPVTAADKAADELIVRALNRLTPHIPVISEESENRDLAPDANRFWLVDPLDGTRSFIRKDGQFTVNIGLIENGIPTIGVIVIPVEGLSYYGQVGQGAWRQAEGMQPVAIATRTPDPKALAAVLSFSHLDPKTEGYIAPLSITSRIAASSSLKFCRIAEGTADLYPRFGPTMEWDTAAGHAILSAAGGRVVMPDGEPFAYRKPGFLNGPFVAWGK